MLLLLLSAARRLEKMSGGSSDGETLYSSGLAFRAFNKSKSGSLSHKELGAGLSQLKIKHKDDVTSLRRLLDRMDIDRDGKVSEQVTLNPLPLPSFHCFRSF